MRNIKPTKEMFLAAKRLVADNSPYIRVLFLPDGQIDYKTGKVCNTWQNPATFNGDDCPLVNGWYPSQYGGIDAAFVSDGDRWYNDFCNKYYQ